MKIRSSQHPFLAENQRMVTVKKIHVKTKTFPIRPVKTKRKHDITAAVDSNVPFAKKAGWSMVSSTKHLVLKPTGKKTNHDSPHSLSSCYILHKFSTMICRLHENDMYVSFFDE